MMHWGDYGWGMGFGWLITIVFWVLAILGIIYLIRLLTSGEKKREREETALDILKRRFAKGEITKEEFEEKKKTLE